MISTFLKIYAPFIPYTHRKATPAENAFKFNKAGLYASNYKL